MTAPLRVLREAEEAAAAVDRLVDRSIARVLVEAQLHYLASCLLLGVAVGMAWEAAFGWPQTWEPRR